MKAVEKEAHVEALAEARLGVEVHVEAHVEALLGVEVRVEVPVYVETRVQTIYPIQTE